MPHKKTSFVAGNPWGYGLNINVRTHREVAIAVRLGVEKQKTSCSNVVTAADKNGFIITMDE